MVVQEHAMPVTKRVDKMFNHKLPRKLDADIRHADPRCIQCDSYSDLVAEADNKGSGEWLCGCCYERYVERHCDP